MEVGGLGTCGPQSDNNLLTRYLLIAYIYVDAVSTRASLLRFFFDFLLLHNLYLCFSAPNEDLPKLSVNILVAAPLVGYFQEASRSVTGSG